MFLDLSLLYYLIIALLRVARNSSPQSFSAGKYHFSGGGWVGKDCGGELGWAEVGIGAGID